MHKTLMAGLLALAALPVVWIAATLAQALDSGAQAVVMLPSSTMVQQSPATAAAWRSSSARA